MKEILSHLNKDQKNAIKSTEGAQLILAGAGSGKTRVVTTKIAYLINEVGVDPRNILAFTFTNKAANEMKKRIQELIDYDIESMWIGTFHSICVRILRYNMNLEGYTNNFSIYDTSDQRTLIRECITELDLDSDTFGTNKIQSIISKLKNKGKSSESYLAESHNYYDIAIGNIYELYQKKLKENNAFDFDDLILKTNELLRVDEEVRNYYQNKFEYVFVDEYQDTNVPQYNLIRLLSEKNNNVTVVGDADQSIYKWRGADINNILNFEKDFKDSNRIILSQNYRSTGAILNAANNVICNNVSRLDKDLWTDNHSGEKPKYIEINDSVREGKYVVNRIAEDIHQGTSPKEIAILYRSNALSRPFEEELMARKIDYQVIGGIKFYDRGEIKDLIAYMRILVNPNDNVSLERIINTPRRGIGETTLNHLRTFADRMGLSLYNAIRDVDNYDKIRANGKQSLLDFYDLIEGLKSKIDLLSISDIFKLLLDESKYLEVLTSQDTVESRSKIENIEEFYSSIKEYEKGTGGNLEDFLADISLMSDVDKTEDSDNAVSLMTVHSAKGLEFDNVYIIGLEEDTFPSAYADNEGDIEEERRLMYVAITRAKKHLTITSTNRRFQFGQYTSKIRSRFIEELGDTIETEGTSSIINKLSGNTKVHRKTNIINMSDYTIDSDDTRAKNANKNYSVGQIVKHRKWGEGVILNIEENKDKKITIKFTNGDIRTLIASYAPLEVIK